MIDFIIFSFLCYIFFECIRIISIKGYQQTCLNTGYHLSLINASMVVFIHLMLMLLFDPLNYHLITYYNFVLAVNLAYAIVDVRNMFDTNREYITESGKVPSKRRMRYYASMIFHHFLMMSLSILSFYIINYLDLEYGWIVSLGYQTEISTPLLNYLQLYESNSYLKILFAIIFFVCRPVNLTYLWYRVGVEFGYLSMLCICVGAAGLLNYYWFYKIYLRGKRLVEEIVQKTG